MERYIFNRSVIFSPNENVIYRISNKNMSIKLNSPSSKCLLLLLRNNGMTKACDLYNFAWDNSSVVTPNNLYQNIFLIRRALQKILDCNTSYIISKPRHGFYICPSLNFEIYDDNEHYYVEKMGGEDIKNSLLRKLFRFLKRH